MYPPSGEQFFLEVHERLKQKYTAKMDTNFRSSSLEAVKYSLTNILGLFGMARVLPNRSFWPRIWGKNFWCPFLCQKRHHFMKRVNNGHNIWPFLLLLDYLNDFKRKKKSRQSCSPIINNLTTKKTKLVFQRRIQH